MPARVELAGRAESLAAAGTPFVWATVVRAERPTSGNQAIPRLCSQTAKLTGSSAAIVLSRRCGFRRWRYSGSARRGWSVSRRQLMILVLMILVGPTRMAW